MGAGFQTIRHSRGQRVSFACDCIPEKDKSMPGKSVKKQSKQPKNDVSAMFDNPEVRLGQFAKKLYNLGAGFTFSACRNGSLSITCYSGDEHEKWYIESSDEALIVLDEVAGWALEQA